VVEIIEHYRDYAPPIDMTRAVSELLSGTDPGHLRGLATVVLTNASALSGGRRRGRSWSRGRKAKHTEVRGLYHAAWRGDPAWIELFVDNMTEGVPTWLLRVPLGRTLTLGSVVFHEIGHHLHATRHPEHREQEDVADTWAKTLGNQYSQRRHPTARTVLRPVLWALRPIVAWLRRRRSTSHQRRGR
jgi:hypothetical protein